MGEIIYDFRSDNTAGAAPELLEALGAANTATASPYGEDDWTQRMAARFDAVFERPVRVFPLATGTGSNAIALAALASAAGVSGTPGGDAGAATIATILCHESAHINVHECGAAEFITRGRLLPLSGAGYKLAPAGLDEVLGSGDGEASATSGSSVSAGSRGSPGSTESAALAGAAGSAVPFAPFALNITEPTDYGTLYRVDEVAALAARAHRRRLRVHMDGARFANALAALDCTPAELTWRAGVDILSFGATKNGAINAEAIVVFDETLADAIPDLLKRGGQLLSKARFVSAQLERYLADDRWLARARRANEIAADLAARLRSFPGVTLVAPVEVNMIFLRLPAPALDALARGPFQFYRLGGDVRLVCRADQEPDGVDALVNCIGSALGVAA